jgi:hypothetical protein
VKFLCVECDTAMDFVERREPGDGTFAAAFGCPACGRRIAMLANPMETQLVGALGVRIGGRELDAQPMQMVRSNLQGSDDAFVDDAPAPALDPARVRPVWDAAARERLGRVPGFVRGMVKRIYLDWAVEQRIAVITPEVMDRARTELGLEGM